MCVGVLEFVCAQADATVFHVLTRTCEIGISTTSFAILVGQLFAHSPPLLRMPKVAFSGCRTAAEGSKYDAAMHAFRKQMVAIFANDSGK